jgi:hypothetical protein
MFQSFILDLTERDVPTNENVDGRTNVTSPNDSGFTTQKQIKEFDSFPEYPLLNDLGIHNYNQIKFFKLCKFRFK